MQTTDKVQTGDTIKGTSTSTSTTYTYSNSSYSAEKGWECPRCGRINAPWVRQCDCPNNWSHPNITWTYPGKDSHEDWWKTKITCDDTTAGDEWWKKSVDTFRIHPEEMATWTTAHNHTVGGSDYWDPVNKTWINVSESTYYNQDPNTKTIHNGKTNYKE